MPEPNDSAAGPGSRRFSGPTCWAKLGLRKKCLQNKDLAMALLERGFVTDFAISPRKQGAPGSSRAPALSEIVNDLL